MLDMCLDAETFAKERIMKFFFLTSSMSLC